MQVQTDESTNPIRAKFRGAPQNSRVLQVGTTAEGPPETQDPKVEEENDPCCQQADTPAVRKLAPQGNYLRVRGCTSCNKRRTNAHQLPYKQWEKEGVQTNPQRQAISFLPSHQGHRTNLVVKWAGKSRRAHNLRSNLTYLVYRTLQK